MGPLKIYIGVVVVVVVFRVSGGYSGSGRSNGGVVVVVKVVVDYLFTNLLSFDRSFSSFCLKLADFSSNELTNIDKGKYVD